MWRFTNREAQSYMFREAPWLERHYMGDRKITDGRIYGPAGNLIRGPQKKVGEPAEVKIPVGYANVPHEESHVNWEKFRELKAEKDGAVDEEWKNKKRELLDKLARLNKKWESWKLELDRKKVPDQVAQLMKVRNIKNPNVVLAALKAQAEGVDQELIELDKNKPETTEKEWDKSRWKEANLEKRPNKITFKKIILWKTIHKDKWFGHKAVKGLHFLDRAMLDAVNQELGRNGKLRKNWYDLDKEMYHSQKNISANEKEFAYPNPDNPKAQFPSLQTNNKGQTRRTYIRSRVVTHYYLDAIYIQI